MCRAWVLILMISSCVFCGCPASCFSSWVLLTTSASCSKVWATCCCSAGDSTVLDWAMLVKPVDSTASKMAPAKASPNDRPNDPPAEFTPARSEEHTSELQSPDHLVCRLLLEKKKEQTT